MKDFVLNILIVEDDIALAANLEMTVEEMGYRVIARVDNSTDALKIIETKHPDLILMDIDIKGDLTGIQVAERIKHSEIPVLFITSFNEQKYFDLAKQTNYIGYLIKPVNKFTLNSAIEVTYRNLSENSKQQNIFPHKDFLFFKKRDIFYRIKIPSILFVSANDNYTIVMTDQGEFNSSIRLFEFQKLLEPFQFFKVHRSHIINIRKITKIDASKNTLDIEGHEIPFSRANKPVIIEKFELLSNPLK